MWRKKHTFRLWTRICSVFDCINLILSFLYPSCVRATYYFTIGQQHQNFSRAGYYIIVQITASGIYDEVTLFYVNVRCRNTLRTALPSPGGYYKMSNGSHKQTIWILHNTRDTLHTSTLKQDCVKQILVIKQWNVKGEEMQNGTENVRDPEERAGTITLL